MGSGLSSGTPFRGIKGEARNQGGSSGLTAVALTKGIKELLKTLFDGTLTVAFCDQSSVPKYYTRIPVTFIDQYEMTY